MEQALSETEKELLFAKVKTLLQLLPMMLIIPVPDDRSVQCKNEAVILLKKIEAALNNLQLAFNRKYRKIKSPKGIKRLLRCLADVKEALICIIYYLCKWLPLLAAGKIKNYFISAYSDTCKLLDSLYNCKNIRDWNDDLYDSVKRITNNPLHKALNNNDVNIKLIGRTRLPSSIFCDGQSS